MPECHNRQIKNGEIWILKDIKGFTSRKLFIGRCSFCKELAIDLIETRISDNKIFINQLTGIEAVKTIYREKKRKLTVIPDIKTNNLYGWIYGHNVQIRNKKGDVVQIRQYASDFKGNKALTKKIVCN